MSKERARRREAREHEAAIRRAARARTAERRERRDARTRALSRLLPRSRSRRTGAPTGVLARRRRRQNATTVALLVALNVLVWVVFPGWPVRTLALAVTLLAAPVLHTILFRR